MVNGVDIFFIVVVLFAGFVIGCIATIVIWLMESSIEEQEKEKEDKQDDSIL